MTRWFSSPSTTLRLPRKVSRDSQADVFTIAALTGIRFCPYSSAKLPPCLASPVSAVPPRSHPHSLARFDRWTSFGHRRSVALSGARRTLTKRLQWLVGRSRDDGSRVPLAGPSRAAHVRSGE